MANKFPLLSLCLYLCLGFFWGPSLAQEVAHEHFRVNREVPFNTVYSQIHQDELGRLWMGTDRGIYRYDGREFTYYPTEEKITDEEILYLYTMDNGVMWGMNYNRQIMYLQEGDDTLRYSRISDSLSNISLNLVHASNKNLNFQVGINDSFGTKLTRVQIHDVDSFSITRKKFYEHLFIFDSPDGKEYRLLFLDDLHLGIATYEEEQLLRMDTIELLYKQQLMGSIKYLENTQTVVIHSYTSGNLPITLLRAYPPYEVEYIDRQQITRINNIFDDRHGNLWLATDRGLLGYDQNLQALFDGKRLFPESPINNIFEDDEQGYWIGTEKKGIYYIPNIYASNYLSNNSDLQSNNITALEMGPQGRLFGGTILGDLFQIEQQNPQTFYQPIRQNTSNISVRFLAFSEREMFVAVNAREDYLFQLDKLSFEPIRNRYLIKTAASYKNKLIMGTSKGVHYLDKQAPGEIPELLSKQRTLSLKIDTLRNYLWIGEVNGLSYYDFTQNQLFAFDAQGQSIPYLINDIEIAADQTIWAATPFNGIFGLTPDSLLYHYTTANGLLSNNCRKLMIDEEQNLWIGHDKGVNRIDLRSGSIQAIDQADGLLSQDVTDISRLDDQLWVATTEGLYRLPIKDSYTDLNKPKVNITAFRIWEEDVPLEASYRLPHDDNNLYIQFQGIYFKNYSKMKYRYRMIGIDSTWMEQGNATHFVRYPQLKPGNYRFEVMAVNGEGMGSPISSIDITIRPAFWQTVWFAIALVAALIGLSQWISRQIRQRRLKEQKYLQRIEELRSFALRSQMNPHFVFNTLNAILLFLIQNDRKSSIKCLSRFAKLIRFIFEHSKYDRITLSEEIQFLDNYLELEQLRFSDRVSIEKDISPGLRNSSILVPPLLIQPLIENAFKHGLFHKAEKGKLFFAINEVADGIQVLVEDNGIGRTEALKIQQSRHPQKRISSHEVLQERIELINSRHPERGLKIKLEIIDLQDEQQLATGTRCNLMFYY
ncbi:MAG: histidine kinase [Bacteroidota bacterium]